MNGLEVYDSGPRPDTRRAHNRYMNQAVIKYQLPLTFICPDCYLPAVLCHHLREPDIRHLWAAKK